MSRKPRKARRIPTEPTAGRARGSKNLKRSASGGYVNEHGVEFTAAEKRKLEQMVNTANRKRKRQLAQLAETPRFAGGMDTGSTALDRILMGQENDLIIAQRSKSLQRFKSREQFDDYMKGLQTVNDRNYIKKRMALYQENLIKGIKDQLGSEADDIVEVIEKTKLKDFMELVKKMEEVNFEYVYGAEDIIVRAEGLRAALGMELKY